MNFSAEVTKQTVGMAMARIPNIILTTWGLYYRNTQNPLLTPTGAMRIRCERYDFTF